MFTSLRGLRAHEGRKHKATGSPIPQLDGQSERLDDCVIYTFISEYAREDVEYTLKEIFPEDVKAILMSRVKVIGRGPRSADHICTSFLFRRTFLGQPWWGTRRKFLRIFRSSRVCLIWGRCPPALWHRIISEQALKFNFLTLFLTICLSNYVSFELAK